MRTLAGEVLAIGDELIQGWNVDTNSGEIARELLAVGVRVERFTAVGDERAAIAAAIREACARADVLVITGGLGPTDDDLTREGAADALGVALEHVPELWAAIEERLKRRNIPVPPSNRRQADRPTGAATLPNPFGSAPGFAFRLGRARAFSLPGVPREMRAMLAQSVLTAIASEHPDAGGFARRVIRAFGATEAFVGEKIRPWMLERAGDPLVGITVSGGIHTISVLSRDAARAAAAVDAMAAELGDLVFAREASALEEVIVRRLVETRSTIALAESCTAGLAAAMLANVPGASAALREAFVTYSNESKVARLGVSPETLRAHGAVSEETAREMAAGAARAAGVDLAVAITGIAGPDGGTPEKPVGLVWIATWHRGRVTATRRNYAGAQRNLLREIAAREALNQARLALKDAPG